MVSRRPNRSGQRHMRGGNRKYVPKETPGGFEAAQKLEGVFQSEYGSLSRAMDWTEDRAAQAEAQRKMSPVDAANLVRARSGDDSSLLPYTPTPSINPPRPRTVAAGYASSSDTLTIKFRDGAVYEYYGVPQNVWRNFRRVKSPGKFVNRVLNNYDYARRSELES